MTGFSGADRPLVHTESGAVLGVREGDLMAWRGIPFAAPPVGERRFRAPHPTASWSGILDAAKFGPAPIQQSISKVIGYGIPRRRTSEDSLTVNVLRPAADAPLRPVMVYIYGGGNRSGTAALYPGRELVGAGDVVYVTFNYRLGVLGFLDFSSFSTPSEVFDSNLGLRDQLAALEWVHRNIEAFGGDAGNVTIFGESAGALAVTTLLAVPAAVGLFHRAIAQSSPAGFAYSAARTRRWARHYLAILGLDGRRISELRRMQPSALVAAGRKLCTHESDLDPGALSMGMVVDGDLLPDYPPCAIASGLGSAVPLIIGTNADEGTLFDRFIPDLATSPRLVDRMLERTGTGRGRLLSTYSGYPDAAVATRLGGDAAFWHPSIKIAEAQARVASVWSYRLDFAPRLLRALGLGATHASDTPLVFGSRNGRLLGMLGDRDHVATVSRRMQNRWLAFARTGRPLAHWPEYTVPQRSTLIIDEVDRIVDDPHADRRRAWNGFADYR